MFVILFKTSQCSNSEQTSLGFNFCIKRQIFGNHLGTNLFHVKILTEHFTNTFSIDITHFSGIHSRSITTTTFLEITESKFI